MTRRKKLILITGLAGVVLGMIGVLVFLEPFAPRYQGQTVNQWLDAFAAKEQRGPERDVLNGFGTNALSTLVQATKGPFWMNSQFLQGFDEPNRSDFFRRNIHKTFARARRRTNVAYEWSFQALRIGSAKGQFLHDFVSNFPDDQFVLRMFRHLQETYSVPFDMFESYTKTSDARLRDRSRRLFKDYKNWDDKTYQQWLTNLDRPNNPFSAG